MGRAPNERNLPLDLLRGICAIGIAAYHYLSWAHGIRIQSLGTFGVYTFFVISAIAMMMAYSLRFANGIDLPSLKDFYWKRITRIMPLLVLVSVAAYIYFDRSLAVIFLIDTGLTALHMPGLLGGWPGGWSLGIEILFYGFFPAICLLAVNCRLRTLVFAFLFLVLAQQVLLTILPAPDDPLFWRQYTMPLTFAPFFAAGLIIYRLPMRVSGRNAALAALLALIMFFFSAVRPVELFEGGVPYLLLTCCAAGAALFAYCSILPRFLHGIAWFVGEISYSLYLTHWLAFYLTDGFSLSIRWAVFAVVAVGLATAVTFLFERPMKRLLRQWVGERRGQDIAAAAE